MAINRCPLPTFGLSPTPRGSSSQLVRPNRHFTFTNLPSGEYRLIAVAAADRYTLEEPNILESLGASAETVNLQPSAASNITLKSTPAKLTY